MIFFFFFGLTKYVLIETESKGAWENKILLSSNFTLNMVDELKKKCHSCTLLVCTHSDSNRQYHIKIYPFDTPKY